MMCGGIMNLIAYGVHDFMPESELDKGKTKKKKKRLK